MFQPFLRFWWLDDQIVVMLPNVCVSTLLEILAPPDAAGSAWRRSAVSTLLEILGLVCLVLVGF